ncbi:unnamed protein product [Arabidopsis halleri]
MELDEDTQGVIDGQPVFPPNRVDGDGDLTIVPKLLPKRVFAIDRYPMKGRTRRRTSIPPPRSEVYKSTEKK